MVAVWAQAPAAQVLPFRCEFAIQRPNNALFEIYSITGIRKKATVGAAPTRHQDHLLLPGDNDIPAILIGHAPLAIVGRLDFVFAAETTETADRYAQRETSISVASVHACHALYLTFGKSPTHNDLRCDKGNSC
jgi:hypothetical protein